MGKLSEKAARLVPDPERLRYAVCARTEVTNADAGVMAITAADVFAPEPGA
ncbi:hypothetical protein [Microbispora sp. NBC_01389]|uniref:hypothetical protein n=1 Tax=Microbispora sp. NBC_01389 TaxID=2903584 RepID=UPI00324A15BC